MVQAGDYRRRRSIRGGRYERQYEPGHGFQVAEVSWPKMQEVNAPQSRMDANRPKM